MTEYTIPNITQVPPSFGVQNWKYSLFCNVNGSSCGLSIFVFTKSLIYTCAFYHIQQEFLYPVKRCDPTVLGFLLVARISTAMAWDGKRWWCSFKTKLSRKKFTIMYETCISLYRIWLPIVRVWYGVSLVDRTKLRKTLRAWIMLFIGNANVWTSTHNKIVLLPLSQLNRIYPSCIQNYQCYWELC